jgi:hypothetical protein
MAKSSFHDGMCSAYESAERGVRGKLAGGYDMHHETMKPRGAGRAVPDAAAQRRSDRANRTGFGSKNVGADLGGGIE